MAATSTSPVKILLDLGIDLDNLSSEENYLSALMEGAAAIESASKGKGDGRSAILREEVVRVRKGRKAASPSKGMKFTLKKKNISAQKLLTSSKEAKAQTEGGGDLLVIKEKVVAIEALLGEQYKLQEENAKDAKQEAEKKRRSLKERLLEGSGKVFDGVKKATNTVLKPFKSVWENIIGFIKKIILGRVLMNILEWTSNKENQGKIDSIFKFLNDWWPVLLTAYLAFGNGLSKFVLGLTGKLVMFSAKLLKVVIPALWKAIVAMGPKGWIALGVAGSIGLAAYMSKEDDEDLVGGVTPRGDRTEAENLKFDQMSEAKGFNKGGQVRGSGNTDTVPAMLTPGEFVMSKGAVQKYGADTLASMNAMGGGTNKPTMGRYKGGGLGVVTDPKEKAQQEAYMLKFVNEERALQGMEPLTNLTYAPGVELTKMMGPGPKTKETSDTNFDFDRGIKTTSRSKTVDGKLTDFGGSMSQITPEEREKFFADNPHAAQLVALKDQVELDALGADISASAKMNGGGLVQGFQGGGSVGRIKFTGDQLKKLIKSSSSKKMSEITPPVNTAKVTVINQPGTEQADASQAQLPPQGNREIPSFDATLIRSSRKMEVLGISI